MGRSRRYAGPTTGIRSNRACGRTLSRQCKSAEIEIVKCLWSFFAEKLMMRYHRPMTRLHSFLLIALAMALTNCRRGEGAECSATAPDECRTGLICLGHQCRTQPQANDWCSREDSCKTAGACVAIARAVGGDCIVAKDEDCARCEFCKRDGWCAVRNGKCTPTMNEHCARTDGCKKEGRCSAKDGQCVAGKDTDCAQSADCEKRGWCTAAEGKCRASSDDACRKSENCRTLGMCAPDGRGGCSPNTDADCARSELCQREGRCKVTAGGGCVRP